MQHAVYEQNLDEVQTLLEQGEDVNAPNEQGITPIRIATFVGNVPLMRLLFAYGANPNIQATDRSTPIDQVLSVVHENDEEILRCLLENGADPNIPFKFGKTALFRCYEAYSQRTYTFFQLLLEYGANTYVADGAWLRILQVSEQDVPSVPFGHPFEETLMLYRLREAIERNDMRLFHLVLSRIARLPLENQARYLNAKNVSGRSCLYLAIAHKRLDMFPELLDAGVEMNVADMNAVDEQGNTLLHTVIGREPVGLIKDVMRMTTEANEWVMDLSVRNNQGLLALHMLAYRTDSAETIQQILLLFLHRQEDIQQRDAHGRTFMHHTALQGNANALDACCTWQETNRYAMDLQGNMPIHLAIQHANWKDWVHLYLIHLQSNVEVPDGLGFTPLYYAIQEGNREMTFLFLLHHATILRIHRHETTTVWEFTHGKATAPEWLLRYLYTYGSGNE